MASSNMAKRRRTRLFVDQYGECAYVSTVRELRIFAGGGRVSRMYIDRADGKTYAIGYVIGRRWFTEYAPVEVEQ